MKRLYSYWTYPYVLFFLLLDIFITYIIFREYNISFKMLFVVTLINAIFIGAFIAIGSDLKRVYLKDEATFTFTIYTPIFPMWCQWSN